MLTFQIAQIFRLSDQNLLSVIDGVDCLQSTLSTEPPKRSTTREKLVEAVVADLGDSYSSQSYLIVCFGLPPPFALIVVKFEVLTWTQVRTENDDLFIYRPYLAPGATGGEPPSLLFSRETNHFLPVVPSNLDTDNFKESYQRTRSLRILSNVSGFRAVFMPGASAGFVFKTSTSVPHIMRLRGDYVRGLSSFESPAFGCADGFVYVDSKVISFSFSKFKR